MASSERKKATKKAARTAGARRAVKTPPTVHELEISLRHFEPRIWRRFAVPSTISLASFTL